MPISILLQKSENLEKSKFFNFKKENTGAKFFEGRQKKGLETYFFLKMTVSNNQEKSVRTLDYNMRNFKIMLRGADSAPRCGT